MSGGGGGGGGGGVGRGSAAGAGRCRRRRVVGSVERLVHGHGAAHGQHMGPQTGATGGGDSQTHAAAASGIADSTPLSAVHCSWPLAATGSPLHTPRYRLISNSQPPSAVSSQLASLSSAHSQPATVGSQSQSAPLSITVGPLSITVGPLSVTPGSPVHGPTCR